MVLVFPPSKRPWSASLGRATIEGMTITFITGANKGIGRETARRLVASGHTVLLGARDRERGEEAAAALGARFVPVDVTDDASVAAPPRTSPSTRAGSTS